MDKQHEKIENKTTQGFKRQLDKKNGKRRNFYTLLYIVNLNLLLYINQIQDVAFIK